MVTRESRALGVLLWLAIAPACGSIAEPPEQPSGDGLAPGDGGDEDGDGGEAGGGGGGGGGGGNTVGACRDPYLVRAQPFSEIYDPGTGKPGTWYVNDHTIVRGADGTWHMFGPTYPLPADPLYERAFGHATAPAPMGPWTERPTALTADPALGEPYIWAPHVYDNTAVDGQYYMFYSAGGPDRAAYKLRVATSPDLVTWTKENQPLFVDGYEARAPHVLRIGEEYVMYYTATSAPAGGNHVVAYRSSKDLLTWSDRAIAYTDPVTGTARGPTESPFVLAHDGSYYLFIGSRSGYVSTEVFRSDDPFAFRQSDRVGSIAAHGVEVVQFGPGYQVTHAGVGQGGLHLATLELIPTACETFETAEYRAAIMTSPFAALSSFALDDGAGGYREMLGTAIRGSQPYLGIGTFAMNCRPGSPASIDVSPEGDKVTLRGVPMCDEPVTVDWTFCARPAALDHTLTWTVTGATSREVHEVAWNLESAGGALGDDVALPRSGDFAGFPRWAAASDDAGGTVIAAYRGGSAFAERNRYYHPEGPSITWQPIWDAAGATWAPATYPGGTWRIGGSLLADDRATAAALADGVAAEPACAP